MSIEDMKRVWRRETWLDRWVLFFLGPTVIAFASGVIVFLWGLVFYGLWRWIT